MDLEFVQFHPTVLFHPDNQNFLISEAVRGEGALLRNNKGELFMEKYHPMKELAPRDVVSRAIFQEMQHTGSSHVFLDITHKDKQFLEHRFPMIYKTCLSYGFDMSKDFIPVAPCQHYSMGGIRTDEWGRTRIKGFYAVGEAACNGIHGANRLASNSLLEGLVFGRRIGRQIKENLDQIKMREGFKPNISYQKQWKDKDINVISMINKLQNIMSQYVGIIRSKEGLCTAINEIDEMKKEVEGVRVVHPQFMELKNMLTLAGMVVKAGLLREESRGAHFRSDFPVSDDKNWLKNIVFHGGTQNA